MALRQQLLAEKLGMIYPLTIPAPSADFFKLGGWVYVTLAATSDGFALTEIPDALKIYASRISPLSASCPLFSPVMFPVAAMVPPGPYDEIFQEAENYADGFAKAVHGIQPQYLDPLNETSDGTRPAKDIGVRLGWDDEQVTIWLNRQLDPSAVALDSPLGVSGYRVDARLKAHPPGRPYARSRATSRSAQPRLAVSRATSTSSRCRLSRMEKSSAIIGSPATTRIGRAHPWSRSTS
jgi:hypothetical protein